MSPPPAASPDLDLDVDEPPRVAVLPREVLGFIQAAEARLVAGSYDEVLAIADRLSKRVDQLSGRLADDALGTALRWVFLLEGEARLALGEATESTESFGAAIDSAPEHVGPPELLRRARLGLARACFRIGAPTRAAEPVTLLLQTIPGDDPAVGEVLRMAGEGLLEIGDLDLADIRWGEAAEEARARESAEELALAHRGLAACTAVRGRLRMSLRQLNDGLGMLGAESDPQVVAGLLGDAVQLECALGRYGAALAHANTLLEWSAEPAPRARALTLLAGVQCAVGSYAGALGNVLAAAELAGVIGGEGTDAKLRTARLLCDLGRANAARDLLDEMTAAPASAVHDYAGQQLALRARASVRQDPEVARSLATTALARAAAGHPLSAMALRLDAARSLFEAGNDLAARNAVKRGLKVVPGADPKGARLELLVLLHELGPDDTQVYEALARTSARVLAELPKELAGSFRARAGLAPALASTGSVAPDPETRPLAVPPVVR